MIFSRLASANPSRITRLEPTPWSKPERLSALDVGKRVREDAAQDHGAIATAVLVGDRRNAGIAMRWHVKHVRELPSRLQRQAYPAEVD